MLPGAGKKGHEALRAVIPLDEVGIFLYKRWA